jgi:hypothetical protein
VGSGAPFLSNSSDHTRLGIDGFTVTDMFFFAEAESPALFFAVTVTV